MWPHFVNLAVRAWGNMTTATSTNTLGFILWTVTIAVTAFAGTLGGTWIKHRLEKDSKPLSRALSDSFWPGVCELSALVILTFAAWCFFVTKAVYDEHNSMVSNGSQLTSDNNRLKKELQDTEHNAEQQCEQAKDKEIGRLKRQLNAACYRPDRHLTAEQRAYLFANLKRLADEMKKQGKTPTVRIAAFTGDRESQTFARTLWEVLHNAGWETPVDTSAEGQKNAKEDEQWIYQHNIITGVVFMEPPIPAHGGFGMSGSLNVLFSQPELDFSTQWAVPTTDVPPHVQGLTMWVGYKVFP